MNFESVLFMEAEKIDFSKVFTNSMKEPGNLLRRAHQISVGIFIKVMEDLDITQLQLISLAALYEKGTLDQVTLGNLCAFDRNTVTVVVKALIKKGLVSKRVDVNDKRARLVTINPGGISLMTKAFERVDQIRERILEPLGEHEKEVFCKLLAEITDGNNLLSRAPIRVA